MPDDPQRASPAPGFAGAPPPPPPPPPSAHPPSSGSLSTTVTAGSQPEHPSRRGVLWLGVGGIVLVIAGVLTVILILAARGGEADDDTSPTTLETQGGLGDEPAASPPDDASLTGAPASIVAPANALPPPTSGGYMRFAPGATVQVGSTTCEALVASVGGQRCVIAETHNGTFALVTNLTLSGIQIDGYAFAATAPPSATRQVQGTMDPSWLSAGSTAQVSLFTVNTALADVLGLIIELDGPSGRTTTLEILDCDANGSLRVVAVLDGVDAEILVDSGLPVVWSQPAAASTGIVTTLYPSTEQWLAVAEQAAFGAWAGSPVPVSVGAPVAIEGPPVTAAPPPPPPPSTDYTNDPRYVPGYQVWCDGSWIAIVASVTGDRVISSVGNHPGALFLRNDETCGSLNPTFSSGTNQGRPIFVVFYGPFYSPYSAQQACIERGYADRSNCYLAPLTNDPADRSRRPGPTDPL